VVCTCVWSYRRQANGKLLLYCPPKEAQGVRLCLDQYHVIQKGNQRLRRHSGALVSRLQTDPAGRVVGLRVPAPWVGPATLMGSHGSGLKYLWGPDPWMGTRWVMGPSLGPGSWVLGIDYVIL
jgi:hypothetical protein